MNKLFRLLMNTFFIFFIFQVVALDSTFNMQSTFPLNEIGIDQARSHGFLTDVSAPRLRAEIAKFRQYDYRFSDFFISVVDLTELRVVIADCFHYIYYCSPIKCQATGQSIAPRLHANKLYAYVFDAIKTLQKSLLDSSAGGAPLTVPGIPQNGGDHRAFQTGHFGSSDVDFPFMRPYNRVINTMEIEQYLLSKRGSVLKIEFINAVPTGLSPYIFIND